MSVRGSMNLHTYFPNNEQTFQVTSKNMNHDSHLYDLALAKNRSCKPSKLESLIAFAVLLHLKARLSKCFGRSSLLLLAGVCSLMLTAHSPALPYPVAGTEGALERLKAAKKVLFLGDSITYAGDYVALLEGWMLNQPWPNHPSVINVGLASETVSGLSEPGHAGGEFPRPDLAERLERVLATVKPDTVVACYGMNCGIYLPFDEQRLQAFQRGYQQLNATVQASGAQLIVITPPYYDDVKRPLEGFSYNSVLQRYAQWLVQQQADGWMVVDLHTSMTAAIHAKRDVQPDYSVQPDGVHPDSEGHRLIAAILIEQLETLTERSTTEPPTTELTAQAKQASDKLPKGPKQQLIKQRMTLLRDAYLQAAGHSRPGVPRGLPLDQAESQAAELTAQIKELD